MTKQKSTKRALLSSAIALLVCVAMLIGTTFAWFTDSVTSKGNIIKSGTLDIEMYWAKGTEDPAAAATSWVDASKGAIFDYDKWEPGYVEARHIKIENAGTLALKYKLNILATGEVSKLAEVIDVYYLDPAKKLEDRDALTAANKIGSLKDVLANVATTATGSLEAKKSVSITIALKMREEAGNEYQGLSIGSEFAIQLLATQYTSEEDSFDNQYDKNAAFSTWDGTVPSEMPKTLVVDADKETIFVKDAAAFAYLNTLSAEWADLYTDGNGRAYSNYANGKGAVYYYSGNWTVSLESDIDLNNHPIDPVNIVIGEGTGYTPFNGNGHVIRNVNTTTGLFADGTRASFSNLTLENVKATRGALIGSSRSSISNVIVKKANISGVDYVGGLTGRLFGSVYNCQVLDSHVVASGKEAGGLVGYAETNAKGSTIANNLVKNVSVYANNRAAGLVAQPNANIKVYNNTVDTVTVGAEDSTTYAAGAIVSNALDPKNVYDNTVINANILGELAIVESNAELSTALTNGSNIVLGDDIQFAADIKNDAVIDLADKTFEATWSYKLGNNSDLTMSNGEYVVNKTYGHVDVRPDSAEGSVVTFENVDFTSNYKNKTYGTCTDRLVSVVEVTPATADGHIVAIFKNCTFNNAKVFFEGMSGKTGSFEAIFENCTFNALTSSSPVEVQNYIKGTITVKNCTFNLECTSSSAAAICVSSSSSTEVTINAENNTINAIAATPYTYDATAGETEVDNIKIYGTPKNIKFISSYGNTTITESNTVKTGIAG